MGIEPTFPELFRSFYRSWTTGIYNERRKFIAL